MILKRKKWLTTGFYKDRSKRRCERKKRQEQREAAYSLWKKCRLSTPKDWNRLFIFPGRLFFLGNTNVHFRAIGKCNSTSMKRLLLRHYLGDDGLPNELKSIADRDNTAPICHHTLHKYIAYLSPSIFEEQKSMLKSVAFVRNPYHRLISCYRNRVLAHNIHHTPNLMIVPEEARTSFANFVHFACQTPNHLRDLHFSSQWLYLLPGLTTFDFIGHTEHFSEHAYQFFSELGSSQALLDSIATKHNHSGHYDWQDYYNETLAQKVYQAYLPDFEAFGYDKDSWRKTFKAKNKAPIRNYNPEKDIERFRSHFPMLNECPEH